VWPLTGTTALDIARGPLMSVITGSPFGSPEPGLRQELSCGATLENAVAAGICLALIVRGGADAAERRGVRGAGACRACAVAGSRVFLYADDNDATQRI